VLLCLLVMLAQMILVLMLETEVLLMRFLSKLPFPMVLVALEMTAKATMRRQKRSYRPIAKAFGYQLW